MSPTIPPDVLNELARSFPQINRQTGVAWISDASGVVDFAVTDDLPAVVIDPGYTPAPGLAARLRRIAGELTGNRRTWAKGCNEVVPHVKFVRRRFECRTFAAPGWWISCFYRPENDTLYVQRFERIGGVE